MLYLAGIQVQPNPSFICVSLLHARANKNEGNISPIINLWGFFRRSMAATSAVRGPIWSTFQLVRDFIDALKVPKYS